MRSALFFSFGLLVLSLSGCVSPFDPYGRPGTWAETGAANETIAQQAADKSDLLSGKSEPGSNGIMAVGGVEQALSNNAKTLQKPLKATTPYTSISVQ
ncbi:hypothetical protein [Acidocella sp. KAb 2-4]|uniref:hypothetical protein n=1 Tax=Acidocella sp. KAb 2-4 TaxID=2885158 RepID=UPI001D06C039|nr:hypothetical protein [Acidocella sp. KAb 2-4]MCB5943198.1 hypothetical protein [Acidocella sp. KAb 2-4]